MSHGENCLDYNSLYKIALTEKVIETGKLDQLIASYKKITESFNLITPPWRFTGSIDNQCVDFSQVKEWWRKAITIPKIKEKIDVYIGIPFCVGPERCTYCMYRSHVLADSSEIDGYLEILIPMMADMSEVLGDIDYNSLYVGGGTPNILTVEQMEYLFSEFLKWFKFKKNSQKTFENSPRIFDPEKLRLVKDYGFNRVSFGVQAFDQEVLKKVKRDYVAPEKMLEIIQLAKKLKFDQINVDLMLGLDGQTKESFMESFQQLIKLRPYSITVYVYRRGRGEFGSIENHEKFLDNYYNSLIYPTLKAANLMSEEYGYHNLCNNDNLEFQSFVSKEITFNKFNYNTRPNLTGGNSCLGFGPSSVSYITSPKMVVNYRTDPDITRFNCIDAIFKGKQETVKETMQIYILEMLYRNKQVDLEKFQQFFGIDLLEEFIFEITCLEYLDKIKVDSKYLYFDYKDAMDYGIYSKFFYDRRYLAIYENYLTQKGGE